MIGTLLKELGRALPQYIGFQAKRVFGRETPHEDPAGATPATACSPASVTPNDRPTPPAVAASAAAADMYKPKGPFDWQILSEPEGQVYTGGPSPGVLDHMVHEPKFILDVGCSGGDFSAFVKQKFPQAKVWGVEPNPRAAKVAAARIDRVLSQMIEEIDWAKEGVQRGDIDTILLFDVLEHIYNPWKILLALRNLMSEAGQVVVSIPNVRNVLLLQDLISGHWRYQRWGLLDITHIRFFTIDDMYRLFYQTGFRVVAGGGTQCPLSMEIFERHRNGTFPQKIELESASITVRSIEDLASYCAVQHTFTLQPAVYDQLSPGERVWIDAPHPPTKAFPAS
jgi:2-polyprenyl-3-methyl-5-hydroxy-6-metoxy-1,4-benzoquinol methylase